MPVMARVTRLGSGAGPRPSTPERYPGASHAAHPSPPTIEPRLKKAEAAAGTPKMWRGVGGTPPPPPRAARGGEGETKGRRASPGAPLPRASGEARAGAGAPGGAGPTPPRGVGPPPTPTPV